MQQSHFDTMIGQLDRLLSEMVDSGKEAKRGEMLIFDCINRQTLKHHAEDMILAGRKILGDLGFEEPKQ